MSPELNDADLERELRRRADLARLDERWAAGTLLPAVRSAISREVPDWRPAPRAARFAGLAAVLAVVVVIILVVPRVGPGPAASPSAVSGLTDPSPTSLAEPTSGPIAGTPHPSPASTRVGCPYADRDPEDTEVGITDLAGVLVGCVTRTPGTDQPPGYTGPGISVSNPEGSTSRLEVSWTESALCETAAELELMRVDAGYVLLVDRQPGEQPRTCRLPSSSYHGVTLELSTSIAAQDVQALLLESGRNVSTVETSGGIFYLTIGSGSREYSVVDAIEAEAVLGYDEGREALVADRKLGFGFEQLDGDLSMQPLWPMICQPQELRREDPLRANYGKSGGYPPSDPNAEFYRRYLEEPELRLPPGIWRIYASASLTLGDDCGGEHFSLTASVIVRVSAGGTADPPSPEPDPSRTTECDGAPTGDVAGAMTLIDHTGLTRGCSVLDPIDGDPAPIPTADPRVLTFEWTIPCAFDVSSTVLDFWSREEATAGSSRPSYLLIASRSEPKAGSGCRDALGRRVVQVVFNAPIAVDDVDFVLTGEGRGGDLVEFDGGNFALSLASKKAEYAVGEPIEIHAELLYDGAQPSLTLSGVTSLLNGFGIEQLDGPLLMGAGWDLPCARHEIRSADPLVFPYVKSVGWGEDDPNAEFYEEWWRDPQLRLPAGTWLVTAYSGFSVGSDCVGPQVTLKAAVVIQVN